MIHLLIVFFPFLFGELKITSIILFDIKCLFGCWVIVLAVADIVMVADVSKFIDEVVMSLFDILLFFRVA